MGNRRIGGKKGAANQIIDHYINTKLSRFILKMQYRVSHRPNDQGGKDVQQQYGRTHDRQRTFKAPEIDGYPQT